ncbi:MAG: glycoside hydrolase family 92 protein, partial [Anaerolineae bacterium]|nr:glycoside hydrolase family 92 protein [Anaerolineae bacterium]
RNLQQELSGKSFEAILEESHQAWNELLGHIQIDTQDNDRRRTFYSALYRTLLFPRQWHEYAEGGRQVHFSPYDGKVHHGVLYTDNGFWDTSRTVYPLLSLLFPQRLSEILNGWLNAYLEGGWMPKWASPGYRDCMIGTHTDVIFADACVKDIPGVDWQLAYEAGFKNATQTGMRTGHFGRLGLAEYLQCGYVPEDRVLHGASRTLDFAYNDFCVGKIASHLGHEDVAADLFARAQNYRNVYDSSVGFMRGRLYDGSWESPFSATRWGGPFVEGSAWQHLFDVPHDIPGLIDLLGGKSAFVQRLDEMMATEPTYEIGSYPYEIHEMTEMAAVDFGQYAHSNQPVHHALYLYSYADAPWKTQQHVRRVLNELYTPDTL